MSNEDLVAMIQAGSPERMGELWEQVRRFVAMQARKVPLEGRADVELDDLIQSGYLALAHAVADYQPGEYTFLTHLGYHLKTQFAIATHFRSERQQRETLAGTLSLDAPVKDEANSSTLGDFQSDPAGVAALEAVEERIFQEQLRKVIADVLAEFPEDQQELLRLRYWEDLSLDEIGHLRRISVEAVRRQENRILRKLRQPGPIRGKLAKFYHEFDFYSGTSLSAFRSTGASVQDRYLMKQDRIRERQEAKKHRDAFEAEMQQMQERVAQRVAAMTPEEKRALLEQYGYA